MLVMGKEQYLREGLEHLNDQSVYEKLPGVRVHKDPGHWIEPNLQKLVPRQNYSLQIV